jgi:hypothetical protein
MGNTFGLKIKNIRIGHILKDLVINNEDKIVEYVYYITKINKFYIENYKKNMLIKEITLFNIFNKKEYNISIELVESGYLFDGLEYTCQEIQRIGCFLLVTNIVNDSYAFGRINAGESILLGDSDKYYNCFKDVENAIRDNKTRFIFYDIAKRCVVEIDFKHTNSLGIECIEIDERYINQLIIDKKRNTELSKTGLFDIEDKDKDNGGGIENETKNDINENKLDTHDKNTDDSTQYIVESDIANIIMNKDYDIINTNSSDIPTPLDYKEEILNPSINSDPIDTTHSIDIISTSKDDITQDNKLSQEYFLIKSYSLYSTDYTNLSITQLDNNTIKHN